VRKKILRKARAAFRRISFTSLALMVGLPATDAGQKFSFGFEANCGTNGEWIITRIMKIIKILANLT
jgi:hypothetical protein